MTARTAWARVPPLRRREIADFLREQAGAFGDTLPTERVHLYQQAKRDIETAAALLAEEPTP